MGRAATLAAALVTALSAWSDKPAGCVVTRVRSVTHLMKDLPDDSVSVLAVIVPEVEDQSSRGDVAELVTIGFVLIANCNSTEPAESDSWDDTTEKLRDYLRTDAAFRKIDLGSGKAAQRKSVSTSVVCDADLLDEKELFVSVTEGSWFIAVGNHA